MRKTGREGEARSDSFLSSFEEVLDQNDAASTSTSEIWRSRRGLDPPPITVDMETRNVYCAKLVMIGVLSIAAVAVAMTTFLITSGQVETEFQQRFTEIASEIIDVSQEKATLNFDSMKTLSLGLTSFEAASPLMSWPGVNLPLFDAQARNLREQLNADWVSVVALVHKSERSTWDTYVAENQGWVQESRHLSGVEDVGNNPEITPYIFRRDNSGDPYRDVILPETYYAPAWQTTPLSMVSDLVNYNWLDSGLVSNLYDEMVKNGNSSISGPIDTTATSTDDDNKWPRAYMATPIYNSSMANRDGADSTTTGTSSSLVGMVLASVPLHHFLDNIVPSDQVGIKVVAQYLCNDDSGKKKMAGQDFTYQVDGPKVEYSGAGDLHQKPRWTSHNFSAVIESFHTIESCSYTLNVYPSDEFYGIHRSSRPGISTGIVILVFFVTALVFTCYDCTVNRRQDKVVTTAERTNAIVDSFFPSHIRDRIMGGEHDDQYDGGVGVGIGHDLDGAAAALGKIFGNDLLATKPIADLFPHATVMFADIVGFTAWASVREPSQVFTLLETVFNAFDKIAKRRHVFKVETIGDCYVAAAGLPDPRNDHAPAMARFARDCLVKMKEVVHQLEITLGPDTGDLTMRIGLHSGAVTGGVLRGDKSRFQLFGDTVDTASRIESTGAKDKIHLSRETAQLLEEANKGNWVKPRNEVVVAKGKGAIQTYWLVFPESGRGSGGGGGGDDSGVGSSASESDEATAPESDSVDAHTIGISLGPGGSSEKLQRLIVWNVDVLTRSLKQVVAMRGVDEEQDDDGNDHHEGGGDENDNSNADDISVNSGIFLKGAKPGQTVLDEVQEIITLPSKMSQYKTDPELVELPEMVTLQLVEYVSEIAFLYRENPFHNFQHASHVTQSLTKLLSRVVSHGSIDYDDMVYKKMAASTLHKFTYGITSDPLTQFACAFSALIHDVDHPGVPNSQLVKEKVPLAEVYKNKSVAEQNSVDIAWQVLMNSKYQELRACIYTTQAELERFRKLVVNSVMATDIVDKELGALRKRRWDKAFQVREDATATTTIEEDQQEQQQQAESAVVPESPKNSDSSITDLNRKATIVIEHLIQAADVAHTMQHWHVYRKWNELFFQECYKAYVEGRAEQDPSIGWYQGELAFFDYYIIPLAKKLDECCVFGVSSDECLNYAIANRREWEMKGKDLVQKYLEAFEEANIGKGTTTSASFYGSPK